MEALTFSGDRIADRVHSRTPSKSRMNARRWIALWCDPAVNVMCKWLERPLSGAFTLMTAIGIIRPICAQFGSVEGLWRDGGEISKLGFGR
jgi:hypothetical protein